MSIRVVGDKELERYFEHLPEKLKRKAIRKAVSAGATALVKQIRRNIDDMVSESSASRKGHVRLDRRGKKTSLKKSIGKKAWSKPRAGLIGNVVGGRWPEGAHAHLVEFGHDIVLHDGTRTGARAQPVPFQRKAMEQARSAIVRAVGVKLSQAIRVERSKHLAAI